MIGDSRMPTKTLWISPTDWVTGDATLRINYPSVAHPATEITTTARGDLKWVFLALRLPPCTEIKAVRVCYHVSNSRSFISQVRLTEMKTPDQALVRHDDSTDLTNVNPTCYVSEVPNLRAEGAIALALRLNFANRSDKIILGAVGVDLRSYDSLDPICDIRFSLQSRYATAIDLSAFGVTNNTVTISGVALLAPNEITVSDFIAKTDAEIRAALENHLLSRGIHSDTNHLIVIDIEPRDASMDPARAFSPASLHLWEGDPRQEQIIEGYKRRIAVAREVLPRAKLCLYQVIAPLDKGRDTPGFQRRMHAYRRAGELGMYDRLDYISPSLYIHYGPNDVDPERGITLDTIYAWLEAQTRQGIEASLTLTRSNGAHIPLAPFLSFWVFNPSSADNRKPISDEIMRRQLRMLQEYCGVKIIVLWAGRETADGIQAGESEIVNAHDFLTQVGELPPRGCE